MGILAWCGRGYRYCNVPYDLDDEAAWVHLSAEEILCQLQQRLIVCLSRDVPYLTGIELYGFSFAILS